jgi:hypothetical protein
MWIEISAFLLGAVVANIVFWFIVLSYKRKQERLPQIVIDDDGKEALKARAMYHGTFDVEKYIIFKKKLSRKQVIIPLRYVTKVNNEIHPRQKKPMLNVHWKNGNVELVSHFNIRDFDPDQWVEMVRQFSSS